MLGRISRAYAPRDFLAVRALDHGNVVLAFLGMPEQAAALEAFKSARLIAAAPSR